MKFGGTSVGSAERMRVAAAIAAEQMARRPVVIVVSAMSKITDLLLDTLRHAEAGDRAGMEANLATLRERHIATCRELLPMERRADAESGIARLIAEFERIAGGMLLLGEMPPRSVDEAVAMGERLSALLIAECLNAEGTPAEAINAAEIVVTDAVFGNASPLMDPTRVKARASLTAAARERRYACRDRLQRGHCRWPAHYVGTRRIGFLGVDSFGRAGRRRAVDLDGCRWHYERRPAAGVKRRRAR